MPSFLPPSFDNTWDRVAWLPMRALSTSCGMQVLSTLSARGASCVDHLLHPSLGRERPASCTVRARACLERGMLGMRNEWDLMV
jgi:hypothetical protein